MLAAWASDPSRSRGRRHREANASDRSEHQRDRDRIVHSTAFRRLVYKTQVFLNHEGDLFRTRLTHSLEVAQLGRSVARRLSLGEDLVEAVALAHDLGHTPFGHAGQDALQQCMSEQGGFEHNLQSLRVVDQLEKRYPDFDGLNLTFEAREGILKHCSRRHAMRLEAVEPGGVGRRFLDGTQPSLEAQIVNLADGMAYNAHDIDDGLRSGLLSLEMLDEVPLYRRLHAEVLRDHPGLERQQGRRVIFEVQRRLLSLQVNDLVDTTETALREAAPASADAVRALPPLARFSDSLREENRALESFLFRALYRHPQVEDSTAKARQVVAELFEAYQSAPNEMPEDFRREEDRHRSVADYIAGMTDRFAIREHHRLTGSSLFGPGF